MICLKIAMDVIEIMHLLKMCTLVLVLKVIKEVVYYLTGQVTK